MLKKLLIIIFAAVLSAQGAAETPAQKQVASGTRRSPLLDAATGGQYSLQDIILGYLDNNDWIKVKKVPINGVDTKLTVRLIYSPDGKQIAFNASNLVTQLYAINILNVQTGQIQTIHESRCFARVEKYSPNGKYLAISTDRDMIIIHAATGRVFYKLKLPHTIIVTMPQYEVSHRHTWSTAIAWSPDGKQVASGSNNGFTRILNAENGRIIKAFTIPREEVCHLITSVSWSYNGKYIASAANSPLYSDDRLIEIWDVATSDAPGKPLICLHHDWPRIVEVVAWSLDDKYLASGSRFEINIWDVAARTLIKKLGTAVEARTVRELWDKDVFSLSWSPDSKYIASSGSLDSSAAKAVNKVYRAIHIWDVATGECIKTLEGFESPTFSPCGNYLAGSDGENIKIWYKNQAQAMASAPNIQQAETESTCTIM